MTVVCIWLLKLWKVYELSTVGPWLTVFYKCIKRYRVDINLGMWFRFPIYIDTGEEQFEQVNSFKYLGTVVNTDNSIEEEIK